MRKDEELEMMEQVKAEVRVATEADLTPAIDMDEEMDDEQLLGDATRAKLAPIPAEVSEPVIEETEPEIEEVKPGIEEVTPEIEDVTPEIEEVEMEAEGSEEPPAPEAAEPGVEPVDEPAGEEKKDEE
jgi:hypothetical protein